MDYHSCQKEKKQAIVIGAGQSCPTERSSMLSSRCRGTTVTSSISHKKATSEGTRPWGRGRAIL